jgi:hypothetical protein
MLPLIYNDVCRFVGCGLRNFMNINLGVGYGQSIAKITMSGQQKQYAPILFRKLKKYPTSIPKWILLDHVRIPLQDDTTMLFACELAATFHNHICLSEYYSDATLSDSSQEPGKQCEITKKDDTE